MISEENRKLFNEIKAKVAANTAKLKSCSGPQHTFIRTEVNLFSKWHCTICGGTVDSAYVQGYEKGLEHARR